MERVPYKMHWYHVRYTGTIKYALVPYKMHWYHIGALVLKEMLWPESYTNNL